MKTYTWQGCKIIELKLPFCKQPICIMSYSDLLMLGRKYDDMVAKVTKYHLTESD